MCREAGGRGRRLLSRREMESGQDFSADLEKIPRFLNSSKPNQKTDV